MTAQVLVVDGPGRVRFVSDEPPGPLPDSGFDVRTRFSGLSAGTDLSWVKGTNPTLSSAWDAELGLFDDDPPRRRLPGAEGRLHAGRRGGGRRPVARASRSAISSR